MIKKIISRITMVKDPTTRIWDGIEQGSIYYWQDYYFDKYIASSRFGFRVKIN